MHLVHDGVQVHGSVERFSCIAKGRRKQAGGVGRPEDPVGKGVVQDDAQLGSLAESNVGFRDGGVGETQGVVQDRVEMVAGQELDGPQDLLGGERCVLGWGPPAVGPNALRELGRCPKRHGRAQERRIAPCGQRDTQTRNVPGRVLVRGGLSAAGNIVADGEGRIGDGHRRALSNHELEVFDRFLEGAFPHIELGLGDGASHEVGAPHLIKLLPRLLEACGVVDGRSRRPGTGVSQGPGRRRQARPRGVWRGRPGLAGRDGGRRTGCGTRWERRPDREAGRGGLGRNLRFLGRHADFFFFFIYFCEGN